jgi:oligosaccharide repeat unit polymerase
MGSLKPWIPGYRFSGSLHPNNQGINCALLVLAGVVAADLLPSRRVIFWSGSAFGLIFLILTASRTSLGAAFLVLAVYLGAVRSRAIKLKVGLSVGVSACLLLLFAGAGMVSGAKNALLMGRTEDPNSIDTFTGRTSIWQDVTPYFLQRPLLGHGYGGFWTPTHINKVSDLEAWGVGNSHSAYVDFALDLGGVGVLTYVCLLGFGFVEAIRRFRRTRSPIYPFCAAVLLFCAINGFFEADIVEGSMLLFLWMVTLTRLAFVPPEAVAVSLKDVSRSSSTKHRAGGTLWAFRS